MNYFHSSVNSLHNERNIQSRFYRGFAAEFPHRDHVHAVGDSLRPALLIADVLFFEAVFAQEIPRQSAALAAGVADELLDVLADDIRFEVDPVPHSQVR